MVTNYNNTSAKIESRKSKIELGGIVLAGGMSSRMGRDKASLPWGESDLLNTVLARLATVCGELIVVSNVPREILLPNVKMARDKYEKCGPLAGMQAGLTIASNDYNFIAACDMPYLNAAAAAYVGSASIGYDAAVPFIDGHFNPLHGVYHRACLPYIERLLEQKSYCILDFYHEINLRRITAEELRQFDNELKMLSNINTPEDLNKFHV